MKKLFLIDANALIHRAFHALPPLKSPEGRPVQALYGLASILIKIWRDEEPDYIAALYDHPAATIREGEYKEYKAQRPKAADDLIAQIISSRELMSKFGIKSYDLSGYEADDLIGTFAEKFQGEEGLKIVILTGDLDTLQLVRGTRVVVKSLKTGVSETVVYDEAAVKARFGLAPRELSDYKALVGDSSDNIPGVPGIGPKTASALIQKYGSLENLYKSLEQEKKLKEKIGPYEDRAFLFKRLVTIDSKAPIEMPLLQELKTKEFGEDLKNYFEKLDFQSLVKRLGFEPSQGALFNGKTDGASIVKVSGSLAIIQDLEKAADDPKTLESEKIKVGFHLKELIKLAKDRRVKIKGPYFDLGVGFWLLDPDFKKSDPDSLFKKYLKAEWHGAKEEVLAAHDFLKGKIGEYGLGKIFEGIEMPLLEVLSEMERRGIAVDKAILESMAKDLRREIASLAKKIHDAAGKKININSPKQLSELLFSVLGLEKSSAKKTATGFKSTNIESLNLLKGSHPIVDLLIKYREIFKLNSTYVVPISNLVHDDGRLRTSFIQTGTATGRLSSQNPNLQNIPADQGEMSRRLRSVFVAEKGSSLVAMDYSQLELRIMASLSGDKEMIKAFRTGEDIHTTTASMIFKVKPEEVSPTMRRTAKTINFGIMYGMGANALAKVSGYTRDEAAKFIQDYFRSFPGIGKWREKTLEEASALGYVRNLNGRRRNVWAINYGSSRLASEAERIATNMPIQSLEADILKLAMIKAYSELDPEVGSLILSVHDELLFEIRDDMIKETAASIKDIMEKIYKLEVPLEVKVKVGPSLAELI